MNPMKYIHFHRPAPTLSVFMIATLCIALLMTPNATTAETTLRVTDGFLQENTVYTDKTILDLTGLDRTRKVSSTATVKNGQVKHLVYITGGEDALPDTLATSLYMSFTKTRIACTAKDVKCYILIEYLPPHTYLVFKETTSYKTDGARSFGIRAGWEANTTVVLLDSVLEDGTGEGLATAIVTMDVSNKRIFTDNCVIHIKKMQVTGFLGFISFPATLEQQSALVVEDVDAISLWYPVFLLSSLTLKDHSAVIVARAKNTHETNSKVKAILQTHSITVDETSVFSLIDVDVSNDYKGTSAGLIIGNNVLSGDGLFVFARLLMQKSGLATMAPVNNANFWVSARKGKSGVDMTVAELQAENFNVNSDHVFNWDGTGADGTTCVPVGGSIPGRATYKLIGGKCTATCKEGFIAPACNAPENKCRVDNCDLCYRVTKTKCMLCAPHTKTENSEQICRCPANLENCQVCPSASACTMCVEGYNLTKGGAPCIPCSKSVPNCAHCDEPNVCERCAPHYNVSTNKKECYACPDKNCISCSGNEVCAECVPHYNLSAIGQPKNRCISCTVPNCQLCKEDDKCDTCIPGYTKPQGQTTCVHCPIEHCERCDVDGVCAQCPDTHTPVDGKHCHPCTMAGCLTCDGDEQCTDCDDKHTLVNQKCVSCDIPNCKSCLIDGVCDECQDTYHLLVEESGATQCVHCDIPNCDACHVDGICHACAPFYSLSAINEPQNHCISCNVPNCQHCKEDDKCDTCAADYTKPEGKTTCAHCPIEHCERCDVDGVCAQCPEKHTPVEGKHCHPCTMPGCLACDGNEKCADCDDTYTKVGHKCVSCDIPNCKSCLVDGICDVCEPRHTLIVSGTGTWQCIPCNIDGCAACDETSHCSVCTNGNPPLHNGKECVSCEVEHCIFCGSADTCHECAASYNVSRDDGKTCHACLIADCLRCDAAGVCAQCSAGLTLSLSGDACTPCDIGNCTYCSAAGECGICACGLVPTSDGTECIPCTAANCKHCALSSSNPGGACAVCSDGYDESEGLCQKSGVPSWAVFLIVLAVTLILAALLGLAVLSYRRHRAKVRQMQIDAGVRRDNRQARGRGARHRTEFGIIDVSELEHVASGIRDEHKRHNIKC